MQVPVPRESARGNWGWGFRGECPGLPAELALREGALLRLVRNWRGGQFDPGSSKGGAEELKGRGAQWREEDRGAEELSSMGRGCGRAG